ncbi:hypothetical protein E2562_022512 [Oryza meyeriana var. granulata]|uniref:Uncharacterized protein n=1 Tax=Oryza meyeriana var. granulata TaxID=110450 RepID=A0A6G1BNC3_9ORYZ|nr:hypothetical protein E2562_022512 [Oryza meyeriana var. granulata]
MPMPEKVWGELDGRRSSNRGESSLRLPCPVDIDIHPHPLPASIHISYAASPVPCASMQHPPPELWTWPMAYVGKEDGQLGATYEHSFVAVDSVGDDVLSQSTGKELLPSLALIELTATTAADT